MPTITLTSENCFESAAFCAWWDAIENIHCGGWDESPMLDLLLDLYQEGTPIADAADQALEAYEIGIAEAWMAVPSWA